MQKFDDVSIFPSIDQVWLISDHETWSAGRTCQMEPAGIRSATIAPLFLADVSKIQQKLKYC